MRTIKFRGKKANTNEWVYGDLLHISGGCIIYHGSQTECENKENVGAALELFADEFSVVIPETVGQFVREDTMHGNKTAFYCGDIVMLEMPYRAELLKAEIYYDNSSCAFRAKVHMDGGVYIHWLSVLTVNSVIGNIFDNADLVSF